MKRYLFMLSIVFIASCSDHTTTSKGKQPLPTQKEIKLNVAANQLLEVEVEGMTCEMGCGGTIRKQLRKTGSVGRVRYDFEEGRKVQLARIFIDSTKINSDEVKKIIESLNKGQFTVHGVKKSVFKRKKLS
jgi:mercuric ion binding protein